MSSWCRSEDIVALMRRRVGETQFLVGSMTWRMGQSPPRRYLEDWFFVDVIFFLTYSIRIYHGVYIISIKITTIFWELFLCLVLFFNPHLKQLNPRLVKWLYKRFGSFSSPFQDRVAGVLPLNLHGRTWLHGFTNVAPLGWSSKYSGPWPQ